MTTRWMFLSFSMCLLFKLCVLEKQASYGMDDSEVSANNSSEEQEGSGIDTFTEENNSTTLEKKPKCPFLGPYVSAVGPRKKELACCKKIIAEFERQWYRGGVYIQTFFEKLKLWKCPQFDNICEDRLYARFSEYSKIVYKYHCNAAEFQKECTPVVASARGLSANSSWGDITNKMTSSEFDVEVLVKPCMQVAMYGTVSGGYGYYHEIVDGFTPFCDISWCGFDTKTIEEKGITSWTCMANICRVNLTIASVVCALLALAIFFANVTVIMVFTTSPKLRNSQAVYKISLAIADLLVGIFVIPTFVSSLMILFKSPANMGDVMKNAPLNSEGTLPRKSGGRFSQRFSIEYLDFVGFFTILSLVVSIYTLMMASFDRFMAIYQPLRYGRHNAKRMAIWASLILWVIAILFSAMPYFVYNMSYGLVASIMVASHGVSASYLYAIAIVLPLVCVWITTLATYTSTKRHARKREALTVRRSNSGSSTLANMEARLAHTLASMVGIFTLCLLPTAIVIIVPFFLSDVYHSSPEIFNPNASKIFLSGEFVAILILMTNSLWNCFIYNARSEDFKKTAKYMYQRMLGRLGFNAAWKNAGRFNSSTMRGRQTTMPTTVKAASVKSLEKKTSTQTLRQNSNDIDNGNKPVEKTVIGYRYSHEKTSAISPGLVPKNEDDLKNVEKNTPKFNEV